MLVGINKLKAMKVDPKTKTIVKAEVVIKSPKEAAKVLSLDEIEQKMIQIATDETTDFVKMMLNEKRIAMLEKVANMKMHRLQLKALEQVDEPVEVQPIEVKFISSRTDEQLSRLDKIDREVRESLNIKQDA